MIERSKESSRNLRVMPHSSFLTAGLRLMILCVFSQRFVVPESECWVWKQRKELGQPQVLLNVCKYSQCLCTTKNNCLLFCNCPDFLIAKCFIEHEERLAKNHMYSWYGRIFCITFWAVFKDCLGYQYSFIALSKLDF